MSAKSFQPLHHLVNFIFLASGVFVLSTASPLYAQGSGKRAYGLPFILSSPSAVAYGMGGGLVSAGTEASAIIYNPAALTRTGRLALEGNTFKLLPQLFDDVRFSHIAGAFQIPSTDRLWLGAAYTYVNLGEITVDAGGPTPLAVFKTYERAFSVAAATKFGQHLRLGMSFKYLRSELAPQLSNTAEREDATASAFVIDFGALYDGFLPQAHFSRQFLSKPLFWQKWAHKGLAPGFSFGVTLANLELKSKLGGEAFDNLLPHMLRLGLTWNIFASDVIGVMITGERATIYLEPFQSSTDPVFRTLFPNRTNNATFNNVGCEINLFYLAAFRFGFPGNNADGSDYSSRSGVSIGPPGLRFSYGEDNTGFLNLFGAEPTKVYSLSLVLDKLP
ncbi:hypothetical protein HUU05_08655 [candidate division KSB1 bacterium]|nr:hypothetical protein [candidate division KSB1 bacterium]